MVEPESERRTDPEPALDAAVSLGEIDPARSRHMWRRSGVVVHDDLVVVGTWSGAVRAFDVEPRDEDPAGGADENGTVLQLVARWSRSFADSPVTLASVGGVDGDGAIAVGGRGDDGTIALLDPADGSIRWSYDGSVDVGAPAEDSVFYWPYVVDLVGDERGETVYAAVRRYERDGGDRRWHSAVLAFDLDGDVRWRYAADASPIAIDLAPAGDRLAVGYNRCFGAHQDGLVVLDAASGAVDWTWDPGVDGDRRVGDVRFDPAGKTLAVTSHGDFRGYVFDADGGAGSAEVGESAGGTGSAEVGESAEVTGSAGVAGSADGTGSADGAGPAGTGGGATPRWRTELATETEIEGQTLYAYPNHVYAHDGRVAFVTGNTYARESRETAGRHPDEHTVFGYDGGRESSATDVCTDVEPLWRADSGGFVHDLAAAESTVVLPTAQNFRVRDAATHSVRTIDLADGSVDVAPASGIVTAAATDGTVVAAIEEPIEYHDEGRLRGSYALHVGSLPDAF